MDLDLISQLLELGLPLLLCVGPILLTVGAIIVLVVILARRKPKTAAKVAPSGAPTPSVATESALESTPAVSAEPATKACPSCGAENPADNAFCEYCGASLG